MDGILKDLSEISESVEYFFFDGVIRLGILDNQKTRNQELHSN